MAGLQTINENNLLLFCTRLHRNVESEELELVGTDGELGGTERRWGKLGGTGVNWEELVGTGRN